MTAAGTDALQRVVSELRHRISHPPAYDISVVRQSLRELAVRVDQAEPLPPINVLARKVVNEGGFAGAGLTDHIGMQQPVRQRLPKGIGCVMVISRAKDHLGDEFLVSHALSLPDPEHCARPAGVTSQNTRGPGPVFARPV